MSLNGAGILIGDGTNITGGEVSVTDGTDTTSVMPDGVYVNGEKIGQQAQGYTGTLNDICGDIDVDFDNEDYSADVYNLHFVNGLLVSVD